MSIINILSNIFKVSKKQVQPKNKELIVSEWEQIDILIKQGNPTQLRSAIIKADKTLDTALKDLSSGEKMAERIVNYKSNWTDEEYNQIWKVHKMRNSIVHDVGYEPTHVMLKNALDIYRATLIDMGVL